MSRTDTETRFALPASLPVVLQADLIAAGLETEKSLSDLLHCFGLLWRNKPSPRNPRWCFAEDYAEATSNRSLGLYVGRRYRPMTQEELQRRKCAEEKEEEGQGS